MATDLSSVTRTIKTLIKQELGTQGVTVTTTSAPPDPSRSGNNLVSVYLYHVIESPDIKNLPPTGAGPVPVQQSPMALITQYIISVLHTATGDLDTDTETEQKLIGLVARTLHDFPVITERTEIAALKILDTDLLNDRATLRLILRPSPPEETLGFWAAQQQHVARLSLFVEGRVIVIDPKPPVVLPGVVLTLGTVVFPGAGPQLAKSSAVTWFKVPAALGTDLRSVQSSPARVALFPRIPRATTPPDSAALAAAQMAAIAAMDPDQTKQRTLDNDLLTLEGAGLAPGDVTLVLKRDQFEVHIPLDTAPENLLWQFAVLSSKITLRVRRNVFGLLKQGNVFVQQDVDLAPGTYTARVLLVDPRLPDKPRSSDELTFSMAPQIISAAPAAGNVFLVSVAGDFLTDTGIVIDLAIAGFPFDLPTATSPFGPGKFQVVDGATLRLQLPATLPTPGPNSPLAVRLLVNGATATPAWITQVPIP